MKPLFMALLPACISITCMAQDSAYLFCYFKQNGKDGLHLAYSLNGYHYKPLNKDRSLLTPVLSKDSLMRDPCIIRGQDGRFHMVWTVSWNDRGIGYASSADLLQWSPQQYLPVMQHQDSALNCWAPEITYDNRRRRYLIYWATTIAGKYKEGSATGDGPYNHRMYYVTTKNFRRFSKTKLLYNKGFNVIDATLFKAGGQWVMVLKDETRTPPQKNLRLAFSKYPHKGFGKPTSPLTGHYWAEGPTVSRVGAEWLIYFDKYRDKQYGAVASTDLRTWQDVSDKLSFPPGARHGTVLRISAAELRLLLELLPQ